LVDVWLVGQRWKTDAGQNDNQTIFPIDDFKMMADPVQSQYLNELNLPEYLRSKLPGRSEFNVRKLSGGVSSLVFLCENNDSERVVIKQALECLAVQEHWPASRERILIEVEAMRK